MLSRSCGLQSPTYDSLASHRKRWLRPDPFCCEHNEPAYLSEIQHLVSLMSRPFLEQCQVASDPIKVWGSTSQVMASMKELKSQTGDCHQPLARGKRCGVTAAQGPGPGVSGARRPMQCSLSRRLRRGSHCLRSPLSRKRGEKHLSFSLPLFFHFATVPLSGQTQPEASSQGRL